MDESEKRIRECLDQCFRDDLTELLDCGDLGLHMAPDGDEGVIAFWFTPDQEAPVEIRGQFEDCTTSYLHPDGRIELYV